MSWQNYFNKTIGTRYYYKNRHVVSLPDNLQMPPTDNLDGLFHGCYLLQDISPLANWDVSKVKNMNYLFAECASLKDISALSSWNVSNVTSMEFMFTDCRELQDITALSSWDTSKVKDMSCMFYNRSIKGKAVTDSLK